MDQAAKKCPVMHSLGVGSNRHWWPTALNMPPSWVVWAVFAAVRFRLVEISVPPGAATLEKMAALAPGVADTVVHWAKSFSHWVATPAKGA